MLTHLSIDALQSDGALSNVRPDPALLTPRSGSSDENTQLAAARNLTWDLLAGGIPNYKFRPTLH